MTTSMLYNEEVKEMENTMAMTDAQIRANEKWRKANTVSVMFRVNKSTDADVLEKLESVDNKRAYLLGLIRKDTGKQAGTSTVTMKFDDGDITQFDVNAPLDLVADIAVKMYNGMTEDVQEQFELFIVSDEHDPEGLDILEASIFAD